MGRKKNYDRDKLIDTSLNLFRKHGFSGTSTQMLVDELGINRFSIYAEFENKENLFKVVLKRYNEKIIEKRFSLLESHDAGLKTIKELIDLYASAIDGPVAGKGCLLCNTAIEFGADDENMTEFIQAYFSRLSRGFKSALSNAKNRGELCDSVSVEKEADYLTATILGIFVMIRAKANKEMIKNSGEMAIRHLDEISA